MNEKDDFTLDYSDPINIYNKLKGNLLINQFNSLKYLYRYLNNETKSKDGCKISLQIIKSYADYGERITLIN